MVIKKIESCEYYCDICEKNYIELNNLEFKYNDIYLCNECLQELNRKIVDYLADKNI